MKPLQFKNAYTIRPNAMEIPRFNPYIFLATTLNTSLPDLLIRDGPLLTKQQTGVATLICYITAHGPFMACLHSAAMAIFGPPGKLNATHKSKPPEHKV